MDSRFSLKSKLLMLEFPDRQVGEADIFLRFLFQGFCQTSNRVTGHSINFFFFFLLSSSRF